ncbi:MAG: molybdenum cofactor biosynthesis protein MoaE [Gammaproteobacteria bacterium]|nr:molybdenum cofactor biosynthesis protein MoaE [Gammaproteobacteria bacterium]
MLIQVQKQDFDLSEVLKTMRADRKDIGAIASFVGLVRDLPDSKLFSMTLEHYPGMTEKSLAKIADQALNKWNLLDIVIIHRVGELKPADQIVLVAVASSHRAQAFAACEYIMDFLKTSAPFWKKETSPGGSSWVEAKDSDDLATERWQ